ncbi:MAG: YihY/virulence factor BrkB family protein [Verrucomicrobiales bacterium]|nr:YihY/virulence factor BrkB family protein [Verrucomicrobiales bacterium]
MSGSLWSMKFGKDWLKYEIPSLAAAVAFYAAVSLFPLVMVLISGVGYFFRFMESGKDAKQQVLAVFSEQFSPDMSAALASLLDSTVSKATVNGPIAMLGFLFVASLAFVQVDKGFMRIWEVQPKKRKGVFEAVLRIFFLRLRSFALMLGMLVAIVFIFVGSTAWQLITQYSIGWIVYDFPEWGLGSYIFTTAMNSLILSVLYRFLAKSRVKWKSCLWAGLMAAVCWGLGREVLARVIIGDRYTAYGIVGSFLVVLLWIYYNAIVLFSGALWLRLRRRG